MAVEHSAVPQPSTSAATLSGTSFEQRWAAWEAKGAAHDRAFRRKLALAAPMVMVIAAIIIFALLH